MNLQWYPGHMTKAKRAMQEDIKLIDVVIELVDARIPYSSRNPDIDELASGKSRMIVLNKSDLADESATRQWIRYYEEKGVHTAAVNATKRNELKAIHSLIQKACREKIERDRRRGILNRPIRAMVAGIPNVGKSTFINSFAGKACTKTGNKPGVTRGKQWIRLNKQVELLDTPGILWPKFEDPAVGLKLAYIGSIRDELLQRVELALSFIDFIVKTYPGNLHQLYGIEEINQNTKILEEIGTVRRCLKKGEEIDFEKTAALLFDDFRHSKLGKISLETPVSETYERVQNA